MASFEEQIAEALLAAFDELGGDPCEVVEAAMQRKDVEEWIAVESTRGALAGGAEMAIPGLHALTIPLGISYLLRKMAQLTWGIGALKGAMVVETPQYSDLRNVLTIWSNGGYYNAHVLDTLAIPQTTFRYALTHEGSAVLAQALERAAAAPEADAVILSTLRALELLTREFGGDERAVRMMRATMGEEATQEALDFAADLGPRPAVEATVQGMGRRLSARLALSLAARISARAPARLVMGFIPLAGPLLNAIMNAGTLRSVAESASKYYAHGLQISDLQALA